MQQLGRTARAQPAVVTYTSYLKIDIAAAFASDESNSAQANRKLSRMEAGARASTNTSTSTHKHTNTQTQTHKHTNTQTQKHRNTETHKHTKTQTLTHTHRHTHTHSLAWHVLMQRKTDRTRRTDLVVVVVLVFVVVCQAVGIQVLSLASWDKGPGPWC